MVEFLRLRPAFCTALAVSFAALCGTAFGALRPGAPRLTWSVAQLSPCGSAARHPGAYGWPIRPFDRPHPVRGNFGDPRTIFHDWTVRDTAMGAGNFQFHNGVDISAATGTPVFAVADGVVRSVRADYLVVSSPPGRQFQYWHIRPRVVVGQRVFARMTVLGRVLPAVGHVHLTELDDGHVVNPLAPGHLFPYEDRRPPTVDRVVFRDLSDHRLDRTVSGTVTVVAQAHDEPSMPVPAPWSGMPVTPARLRWSIEAGDGRTLVGPIVAVDFTRHLPLPRDFWRVYAPGTYQNFPVVGGRYFFGTRGRYLFRLVSLDTRTFANGSYRLDVAAATSAETSAR